MFFFIAIAILWLIHGYVAWRVIPTLGLLPSQALLGYILVFLLSLLPILPILLRFSGNETKMIDRISLLGYTSLGFFVLSFFIFILKDFFTQVMILFGYLFNSEQSIDDSKREFILSYLSKCLLSFWPN